MYIGVDPGKKGCLTILHNNGNIKFFDWPKNNNIKTYFDNIACYIDESGEGVKLSVLERVHAMPGQGVSSTFSFGVNYGMWLTFFTVYPLSFITVPPQTWMKGLISKADGIDTKAQTYITAKRLFPNAELTGPKGGRLDGRADSLLMSHYAMLYSKGMELGDIIQKIVDG